mmetsp:Transcript_16531/g.37013  ORF Transcript_16531/g.37013 Transcript_16531/m.37013 type:complete len:217 (-) Transcript_16531:106-756(-)
MGGSGAGDSSALEGSSDLAMATSTVGGTSSFGASGAATATSSVFSSSFLLLAKRLPSQPDFFGDLADPSDAFDVAVASASTSSLAGVTELDGKSGVASFFTSSGSATGFSSSFLTSTGCSVFSSAVGGATGVASAESSDTTLITRMYFPHCACGKLFRFLSLSTSKRKMIPPSSSTRSDTTAYVHLRSDLLMKAASPPVRDAASMAACSRVVAESK